MRNANIKQSALVSSLFFLLIGASSISETVLLSIGAHPQAGIEVVSGTWQREQNIDVLKAAVPSGEHQISLLRITNPPITARQYLLKGRVRGSNISDNGYLELISTFPDGNAYFSRTLSKKGPQAKLSGSFDWRYFSLPFILNDHNAAPHLLSLNFAAAEGAEISLSALQLTEGSNSPSGAWLTEQTLGTIGGILGALFGCFGLTIGILGSRARARSFVVSSIALGIGIGFLLMIGGLVAAAIGQPEYVYISLLLSGIFIMLLLAGLRGTVVKRYQEMELRRMQAHDTK